MSDILDIRVQSLSEFQAHQSSNLQSKGTFAALIWYLLQGIFLW